MAVTSLAFPAGDVNNFVVGSEEGAVYTACRHGSRAGVMDVFEGHQVCTRMQGFLNLAIFENGDLGIGKPK